jgi:hypothetical protein
MFENVQFFSHLHFKIAKSAIMTKFFCFFKYQYGYQKNAEFYADFKFVDGDLNKYPLKKLEPKNYANFEYFRFCAFFRCFWLITLSLAARQEKNFQSCKESLLSSLDLQNFEKNM